MNFFRAFRVAEAARHRIEKAFGGGYYVKPPAANQITELFVMACKILQLIERIGIRNRDEYARKNPRPIPPLDQEAFERFYRALRVSLEDPGLRYEEEARQKAAGTVP